MTCFSSGRCLLLSSVALMAVVSPAVGAETITPEERQFFEERIRPVLVKHCYECHSHEADSLSAEYALDTREGLRAGGARGEAAIVPGSPDESPLLEAVRYKNAFFQMPPEKKLPDAVIADFERWIAMGAPDPRTESPEALKQKSREELARQLWSLQPLEKPAVPRVQNERWPKTAIDRFVLARMEKESLHPVADADPRALIRRLSFDLTGLPPDPKVVEQFAESPTPKAYRKIVDSMLDSPRFGERWGRHWLDLARYAESSGMEFNFTYPHAWPYRDYVIDSFNEDKPYDRFITEQIAGDLLPASSPEERIENRLGTGFLAIGPKRHNAGSTTFHYDMVDDQIRTTTSAILGLTVGCARCHDHKFDPISTKDYYALAGIFLSTETLYGTTKIKYSRHPSGLIPFGENAQKKHKRYQAHQEKVKKAEKTLSEKEKALEKLKGKKKKAAQKEIKTLKKKIERLKKETPQPPQYAMGAAEGEPTNAHVAIGGDPGDEGDLVPRGFLSAVAVEGNFEIDQESSGRLMLAKWITSRDNPLTARVMANRLWQHLFGRGIVPTVNNFGVLGKKPTHPKLLDYLAVRFMEEDWSIKSLIRSIVMSRAYQLGTWKDPQAFQIDPGNRWFWRMTPRRLEVEPLRDAILAVSGQLNLSRPESSSVTALGQELARRISYEKLNPDSLRRSVYLPVVRHYTPHMYQNFDFAASSLVVGDRAETTTAQQALFFLNGDFILEQAKATARRAFKGSPNDPSRRIQKIYQRALSRPATSAELTAVKEYLRQVNDLLKDKYPEAKPRRVMSLASFVQTIFGSAEFRYLIHPPREHSSAIRTTSAERGNN